VAVAVADFTVCVRGVAKQNRELAIRQQRHLPREGGG
jgi:hypothetical protein